LVWLLRKCKKCNEYSLQDTCPKCSGEAISPHPAKFSMDDKYRKYKLLMKRLAKKSD
jgi:H/ACA ribonucleoprotein complex subunit 3